MGCFEWKYVLYKVLWLTAIYFELRNKLMIAYVYNCDKHKEENWE